MKIIIGRPKGMSYEKYKLERKASQRVIKRRVKHGEPVYMASELTRDRLTGEITGKRTYPPAVKSFDKRGRVVYKAMSPVVLQ